MRVNVRLLGRFEVQVEDVQVPPSGWTRRAASDLVKLLALQPGHRLTRDQVVDALWPDLLVEQAAPRLHKAAHYARRALGSPDAVVLRGDVVTLLPEAEVDVDVEAFDAAEAAARADGGMAAARQAAECYAGDLLPDDRYETWTDEPRERRRLRYLELLRSAGMWAELVAADPLDEAAHLALVRDLLKAGDRQAALRQLDRMEDVLRHELDAEPSEDAHALRVEVLATPLPATGSRAGARWTPVPVAPTSTVGRDREVADVVALLGRARVVTLLGPGGVGKTRLAIEAAHRYADQAAVDACFVDLTKVADAALVPELVGLELGLRAGPSGDWEPMLAEALRDHPALLVLDNVEHVVDAAAAVSRLVQAAPVLHVLTTSRVRLHVAGEHVLDVAPLPVRAATGDSLPDAMALFAQVAASADPSFTIDDHVDDVRAICTAVDGLPLAIELAAGHVRTLPPELLRARLGARLASPAAAGRDVPNRQRTIPATIDWSLQLLDPADQKLFTALGVFACPVTLDAVEAVCSDGDDVVDRLSRLVDASLVRRVVRPGQLPRFTLLELVRERARQLLGAQDDLAAGLGRRHAAHVVGLLEQIDERRWHQAAGTWIEQLTELLPEVRAAHGWAERVGDVDVALRTTAALGTYWHREGHHAEGRRWVAHALQHLEGVESSLVARVHLAAGFLDWPRETRQARWHWAAAADLFRRVGHQRYLAYALGLQSGTYVGDAEAYDIGLRMCDDAIQLARRLGERPLLAQVLNVRGELTRVHGDDEQARTAYEEGLELAVAAGDEAHVAIFLANLAYLAVHRGDSAEARRLGREALRTCWRQGHRMMSAWTLSELAGPALLSGEVEHAALLVGAADEAIRRLGAPRHPGDVPEHERVLTQLRTAVGPTRLEELLAQGARLSLDAAVDLALGDVRPATPAPRVAPDDDTAALRR